MFDKILVYVIIGIIALGGITGTIMYTKIQNLEKSNLELVIERDNLKTAYLSKELELNNSKEVQKSLSNIIEAEKQATIKLTKELEAIKNEPETDNGSVSPLLRRSIERLHNNN